MTPVLCLFSIMLVPLAAAGLALINEQTAPDESAAAIEPASPARPMFFMSATSESMWSA